MTAAHDPGSFPGTYVLCLLLTYTASLTQIRSRKPCTSRNTSSRGINRKQLKDCGQCRLNKATSLQHEWLQVTVILRFKIQDISLPMRSCTFVLQMHSHMTSLSRRFRLKVMGPSRRFSAGRSSHVGLRAIRKMPPYNQPSLDLFHQSELDVTRPVRPAVRRALRSSFKVLCAGPTELQNHRRRRARGVLSR